MNKLLKQSAVLLLWALAMVGSLKVVAQDADNCNELFASKTLEAVQKGDIAWLMANTSEEIEEEALQTTLDNYRSAISSDRYDYFGFQGFRQAKDGESRERFNGHLWFNNGVAVCGLNIYTKNENGSCKLSELRFYGYSGQYRSMAYPGGPLEPADVPPPPPPPPPVSNN